MKVFICLFASLVVVNAGGGGYLPRGGHGVRGGFGHKQGFATQGFGSQGFGAYGRSYDSGLSNAASFAAPSISHVARSDFGSAYIGQGYAHAAAPALAPAWAQADIGSRAWRLAAPSAPSSFDYSVNHGAAAQGYAASYGGHGSSFNSYGHSAKATIPAAYGQLGAASYAQKSFAAPFGASGSRHGANLYGAGSGYGGGLAANGGASAKASSAGWW